MTTREKSSSDVFSSLRALEQELRETTATERSMAQTLFQQAAARGCTDGSLQLGYATACETMADTLAACLAALGSPSEAWQLPVPLTADALTLGLVRLRDHFALGSQEASTRHCGTGSWWELSGYADVLSDALTRIHNHRKRVERQDRAINTAPPARPADTRKDE